MNRVTMPTSMAAVVAAALLLSGATFSYLVMRTEATNAGGTATLPPSAAHGPSSAGAASPAASAGTAPLPDVVVALSTEAIERARIVTTAVASGGAAGQVRLPGVVEVNGYRQVAVTSLVAGRVTRVSAELGERVRRGQTLLQIYSPALAEAQTKYASGRAMLEAHDRELQRTGKLVEIGAASRQELERIHAEHAAQSAAVQSARAQLELLGVPSSSLNALVLGGQVQATTTVSAPIDGVVTERVANTGVNVDPATKLFTVADLSTVWIVADVYEKDLAQARVGAEVTITTAAAPEQSIPGRVSYVDPQVNPATRTAKVRIEVASRRGELRPGMYAEVVLTASPGAPGARVPRTAIQNVGDRTVVYLVESQQPGRFTEREVH